MSSSSISLTALSPKWISKIDEEAFSIEKKGVVITNILLPMNTNSLNQPSTNAESKIKLQAITLLKALQTEPQPISRERLREISQQVSHFDEVEAFFPLESLVKELARGEYDGVAINKYFSWSLKLTLATLQARSPIDEKVQKLYQRVMHGNDYEILPRNADDSGHSLAFILTDKTTMAPFAILKQSDPEYFSSFTRHLPEMPVPAPVWEHELIGYEQDQQLGLDHTPATLAVSFINLEKKPVRGIIQAFIPNTGDGSSYYSEAGADALLAIPKSEVQLVAVSGMLKGLSAGHMGNYILETPANEPEKSRIYEIDLEEMLLPYNRLSEKETINTITKLEEQIAMLAENKEVNLTTIAKLEEDKKMARRSLVLCRMWILGLPQNGKPFDRAALYMMANPALQGLLDKYQQEASEYSSISQASWKAQQERMKVMRELAVEELRKETPSLTPRDLYFKLFGGDHLWAIAQEKGYPPMIAFNNLISDPYQHLLKDLANPASIPVCKRLKEPRDNSPEALGIFNFFRKMENASK